MHLEVIDYVLWLASPCLQVGIAILMVRRGLVREFPVFFAYTLFQAISTVLLVIAERYSYALYYYSYWTVASLSMLVSFGLLSELFRSAFRLADDPRDFGEDVFRWALIVVFVVAALIVLSDSGLPHRQSPGISLIAADRIVRGMLCALASLVLACSGYLSISWREEVFGIALGFFAFAVPRLIVDTFLLLSLKHKVFFGRVNSGVYICSCVIWLAYAVSAARRPAPSITGPEMAVAHTPPHLRNTVDDIEDAVDRTLRT